MKKIPVQFYTGFSGPDSETHEEILKAVQTDESWKGVPQWLLWVWLIVSLLGAYSAKNGGPYLRLVSIIGGVYSVWSFFRVLYGKLAWLSIRRLIKAQHYIVKLSNCWDLQINSGVASATIDMAGKPSVVSALYRPARKMVHEGFEDSNALLVLVGKKSPSLLVIPTVFGYDYV